MERVQFLSRLTSRLAPIGRRTPAPPPFTPPRELLLGSEADMLGTFLAQADVTGQTVWVAANRAEAFEGVRELIAARGFTKICAEPELVPGLGPKFTECAPEEGELGLCLADFGIAETGTVVLLPGGGRRRTFSLLPFAAGFFLPRSAILPRITALLPVLEGLGEELPACVNLITGPSRTADIELELCLGVHGPAEAHVWVIGDE